MLNLIANTQLEASQPCRIPWSRSSKWVSTGWPNLWIVRVNVGWNRRHDAMFVSLQVSMLTLCPCMPRDHRGWSLLPVRTYTFNTDPNLMTKECPLWWGCLDFLNFSSGDKLPLDSQSTVRRTETYTSGSYPQPLPWLPWPSHLHQNTRESELPLVFVMNANLELTESSLWLITCRNSVN